MWIFFCTAFLNRETFSHKETLCSIPVFPPLSARNSAALSRSAHACSCSGHSDCAIVPAGIRRHIRCAEYLHGCLGPKQIAAIAPLLDAFRAADYFSIDYFVGSTDEYQKLIESGDARVALVIPADYDIRVLEGNAKVSMVLDGSDATIGVHSVFHCAACRSILCHENTQRTSRPQRTRRAHPRLSKSARRFGTTPISTLPIS